jgi:hypothetical protein
MVDELGGGGDWGILNGTFEQVKTTRIFKNLTFL